MTEDRRPRDRTVEAEIAADATGDDQITISSLALERGAGNSRGSSFACDNLRHAP